MRESIGGTLLFWIVLIFLAIFITFMASVIKYAFTYKMKNSIINYIERYEGLVDKEEIEKKLSEVGYPKSNAYMVCKLSTSSNNDTKKVYWYVRLNASFQMPIINSTFNIPIQGETAYIGTGLPSYDTSWRDEAPGNCVCRGMDESQCVR